MDSHLRMISYFENFIISEHFILLAISLSFLIFLSVALYKRLCFKDNATIWLPNENVFIDPRYPSNRLSFPPAFSAQDSDSVYLSIIIPSFNEESRLPLMLDETLLYLKQRSKKENWFTWELLIVDDGSRDSTTSIGLRYSKREGIERVRVLSLALNRGKGGAVKRGMMCARGQYLLFADADGATSIEDFSKLEKALQKHEKDGLSIAIGSRAHLEEKAMATRSTFRNILMRGFHFLLTILGIRGIRDTQCGFKLFTRKSAQLLFPVLHIERWAFDVELIFLAQHLHIPLVEVAVNWKEIPGSKLSPMTAAFQMARDLLKIRAAYFFGLWKPHVHRSHME